MQFFNQTLSKHISKGYRFGRLKDNNFVTFLEVAQYARLDNSCFHCVEEFTFR